MRSYILNTTSRFALAAADAGGTPSVSVMGEREKHAFELAGEADKHAALTEHLTAAIAATEERYMAEVYVYNDLVAAFGEDVLDTFPIPGTEEKDKDGNIITNNPDIYERPSQKKGSSKMAKQSWCNDFADSLKIVRDIDDKLKDAANLGTAGDAYRSEQLRVRYEKQKGVARSIVKSAIKLHHWWTRAAEYTGIKLEWVEDLKLGADGRAIKKADGTFEKVLAINPRQIWIIDAADHKKFKQVSVGQFCGIDFDAAESNPVGGGTFAAILKDLERGTPGDDLGGGNPAETFPVTKSKEARAAFGSLDSFYDLPANYSVFVKELEKADPDTDEYLLSLNHVKQVLIGALAPHGKRIARLLEAQDKADKSNAA